RRRPRRCAASPGRPTAPRTVAGSRSSVPLGTWEVGDGRSVVVGPAAGHVVADLVEMALDRLDHGLRVATLDRRQDRGVEVGRPLRVSAGDDERDVRPGEGLERTPYAF